MSKEKFIEEINKAYTYKGDYLTMGGIALNGQAIPGLHTKIALRSLNRHGLIAGATGTGKTKTLQVMAEQMSLKGIPCLLMDIKGDLSGLAAEGSSNDFIDKRHQAIELAYEPRKLPVELMSLSEGPGVRMKATVSEFGPVLLSKIMGLNDTQSSVISMLFVYCDTQKMPLLDLKDLRKVLQYVSSEGKEELEKEYGSISPATVNAIMRKVIELEQQGADRFFGERSFEPKDLLRKDQEGNGMISIVRLMDIQNKPKLFSTFMLCLLAEIYESFPEEGDLDKPKLCIFIDEAHLVFKEASRALLDQLEVVIKLIRSKGVGVFFCTQDPTDVPEEILSQLGLKVQHALRAFTEKDRKAIKRTAENYPISDYYEADRLITELGIGEAMLTSLNEKGIPTPLVSLICRAPLSRMDILSEQEVKNLVDASEIAGKYNEEIDSNSAYEILTAKLEKASEQEHRERIEEQQAKEAEILEEKERKELEHLKKEEEKRKKEEERELKRLRLEAEREKKRQEREKAKMWKDIAKAATRSTKSNSLVSVITRGILGVLGIK
ncbi:MAG: DUF853 family protein [Bacteroidetes bacterium]|nr:MAG: DUF853 family protein [Bacteroidota bacterium]